jgi:hypothetical protein
VEAASCLRGPSGHGFVQVPQVGINSCLRARPIGIVRLFNDREALIVPSTVFVAILIFHMEVTKQRTLVNGDASRCYIMLVISDRRTVRTG